MKSGFKPHDQDTAAMPAVPCRTSLSTNRRQCWRVRGCYERGPNFLKVVFGDQVDPVQRSATNTTNPRQTL
jgi:hypothetical protein